MHTVFKYTLQKMNSEGHYLVVISVANYSDVTTFCHRYHYQVVTVTIHFLQCMCVPWQYHDIVLAEFIRSII